MKYDARTPDASVNVSRTSLLGEAFYLVIGVVAVVALIAVVAALAMDVVVQWIPPDFEAEVFADIAFDDLVDGDVEELPAGLDAARFERASRILDELAAEWPDCPYTFRLRLMPTEEVNALAFPGGLVVVTSGLLRQVESENELAMVLGHELGHFYHRDHLRQLGRGMVYGLAVSALLGRTTGPAADLAGLGGDLAARSFDRQQETDADHFGLELVAKRYGHVAGSTDFFIRLATQQGDDAVLAIYLDTHPKMAERDDDLLAYAADHRWPTSGDLTLFAPPTVEAGAPH